MAKKWLYVIQLSLILMAVATNIQAANDIAVVNMARILQELPAREAADKQLENEFAGRRAELDSMKNELEGKIKKLQSDGRSMKEEDRIKLEKDLTEKRKDFTQKATQFEENRHRRYMDERNKILKRIQNAINLVASQKNYAVVIEANAAVYVKTSIDITAAVQKQVK